MLAGWQTDWAIKLKTWTRQPVPMISKHLAHSTLLPFWHSHLALAIYKFTYIHDLDIHTYIGLKIKDSGQDYSTKKYTMKYYIGITLQNNTTMLNKYGPDIINKANLRDLIAATGLVILLKLDSNRRFFSRETPNLGQNRWFFSRVTLKFDGWPSKTIGHLFYATSSFVQHFVTIGEFNFKLELQSGNT